MMWAQTLRDVRAGPQWKPRVKDGWSWADECGPADQREGVSLSRRPGVLSETSAITAVIKGKARLCSKGFFQRAGFADGLYQPNRCAAGVGVGS